MNYWLVKSEPSAFSWADLVKSGAKGEPWTGVRNHTAKQNLMKMKKGDRVFFYHSVEEKQVVGVAEVRKEHYPDPTAKAGDPWVVVDLEASAPLPKPVTLTAIKEEPRLKDGVIPLPTAPGLGIKLNRDALARFKEAARKVMP